MSNIVDIAKQLYANAPGGGELVEWECAHTDLQAKWVLFARLAVGVIVHEDYKLDGVRSGRFSSKGPNLSNKPRTEQLRLELDRDELRMGKYTSGYENLTAEQLHGLLWLLGEWSCRADFDGSIKGGHPRGVTALKSLRGFHRNPLTLEEVQEMMRNAAGGRR